MYVGNLYKGRGIDLIEQLAQTLPEIDFIIIGGSGNDLLDRKTKSLQMGINNLIYYGFIPNSELHDYYEIADLLIMPYQNQVSVSGGGDTSKWMSPMKTFEYMASGKPLISSDLPVLREVLDEDVAILVDANNLEQWKSSIQNALTNTALTNRIVENARQKAQQNTWECRAFKILSS
jgi:glycosyltransferase involved in cell wall biosynthesis